MAPSVLILRTAGTNCDQETACAFELAGATPRFLHINRLLENFSLLHEHQILAIPGGFSYGDDISSGRIFANQLTHHLAEPLRRFVEAGKPIIGICNGFQVLIKTALLPGPIEGSRASHPATLTHNDCHRFIDRWVHLKPAGEKCVWTRGLEDRIELPIAHGEGKFVPANEVVRKALWDNDQIALVYTRPDGSQASGQSPLNPNGSIDDIAGICDETGLIFGLMPHPERHLWRFQHPNWTRTSGGPEHGQGLRFFQNAVVHVGQNVGAGL